MSTFNLDNKPVVFGKGNADNNHQFTYRKKKKKAGLHIKVILYIYIYNIENYGGKNGLGRR
jgi:hypothetical protein